MPTLDSVLASIPGYGGFQAKRAMNEQAEMQDLQQIGALMKLRDAIEARQQGAQAQQRESAIRAEIEALPPEKRTREFVLPIILKHAGTSKDIIAALPAAAEKGQPIGSGGLRMPDGTIVPPAARPDAGPKAPQVRRRYDGTSVVQEELQADGTWKEYGRGTRFAPAAPEKPQKLPPPKVGYRYKADGSGEQEPIPGGPVAVKLKADQVQAEKSANLAIQSMTSLSEEIGSLKKDPGLTRITGPLMGRAYNVTPGATGAQAKLDKIKAQSFVAALQAMREASKTGGAVGQVTEKEGDKLERTLAALDQAQGTSSFGAQLDNALGQLQVSMSLIRKAYEDQYNVKLPDLPKANSDAPASPQPAAGGDLSPAERQRLEYLRKKRSGAN